MSKSCKICEVKAFYIVGCVLEKAVMSKNCKICEVKAFYMAWCMLEKENL